MESLKKGRFQRSPMKSQAVTWGLGNNILPLIFLADLSKLYRKFLQLIYAISVQCFWLPGKLVACRSLPYKQPLKLPRFANRRCTGHATMSTEHGKDLLITANSARTFLLSSQTKNPLAIWLSTVLGVDFPTTL